MYFIETRTMIEYGNIPVLYLTFLRESNMFTLNLFNHKKYLPDNAEFIVVDNEPMPLNDTDYDIFHKDLDIIHGAIKKWIISDLDAAPGLNIPKDRSISYIFNNLNLKNAVLPEAVTTIENIAHASSNDYALRSYSRWQDTIMLISITCRTTTLDTLRARFLDYVLYGIDADNLVGTKEDWCDVIKLYTWIPLLVILQNLFANDDDIKRIIRE